MPNIRNNIKHQKQDTIDNTTAKINIKPKVNLMTKVLYLATLCKGSKPDDKVMKIISDAVGASNGLQGVKSKPMDSRKFVLKYIPEFLDYAIDYSLNDKAQEYLQE